MIVTVVTSHFNGDEIDTEHIACAGDLLKSPFSEMEQNFAGKLKQLETIVKCSKNK